jgi:thioredoxin-dependent peroxiredoxin
VLGISPQGLDSHERWIAKEGFPFPLLADEDKSVGRAYGVVGLPFGYRRSIFVIDGEGVIRSRTVKMVGATWPSAQDIAEVLSGL